MTKFISIDPGVEFGFAVWNSKSQLPENFGVFAPPRTLDWLSRCRMSMDHIRGLLFTHRPEFLICEWPAYRESAAGRAAAASDSLVKLSVMVGMTVAVCYEMSVVFEPIPVPQWLGNMSDMILKRRVDRLMEGYSGDKPKSHAVDAVGLGFFKKGLL